MKCLSVRVIAPSLLLIGSVLSPVLAWSMNEMTDDQLATTTGQDGITALIAPPTLTVANKATVAGGAFGVTQTNGLIVGAVVLHDKDGTTATDLGGALIVGDASQANTANAVGVQMGLYGDSAIVLKIDVTGNGNVTTAVTGVQGSAPVLNINVVLPSSLLIRTGDISVDASKRSVRGGNPVVVIPSTIPVGVTGAVRSNAAIGGTRGLAVKIMDSMDISFGSTPLSFNVQFGNTPQGGMISFGALKIPTITFSKLSLASPNGGVNPSQLSMTPTIRGLDLTGATISVANDVVGAMTGTAAATPVGGVIFSDDLFTISGIAGNAECGGAGFACGIVLSDLTAGKLDEVSGVDASGFTFANGMKNAPLGSFGVTNMTVTKLKIAVSGM